jgi:copper(I)-binding protein
VSAVRGAALLLLALFVAGCVHYPSVENIGGIRIVPRKGRAVRHADGALVYMELHSTGKFGDAVTTAFSPVAREAQLVPPGRMEVPGTTVVTLEPEGPHVVLSGLTRPLVPGESIIVTLIFEKSGGIGVITVVE